MSNDPISYAEDIVKIVDQKISELPEIFADEEGFNNYTNSFYRLIRTKGRFLETVAQQIGGVYINKIASSQTDFESLEPVPYEKQKQAFELLKREVFSNGAMDYDPKILANLIYERDIDSFYATYGDNNDPDFHSLVLASQSNILRNILHPAVMRRLVNSSLYGNRYMPDEVLSDLNGAIFVTGENPDTFKKNLQSTYVNLLIGGFNDAEYDEISKAAVYSALKGILDFSKQYRFKSGHFDLIYFNVNNFFENK